MFTLIVGGAASSKSEYAERLAVAAPLSRRFYIATMQPWGEETRQRIARHRAMRAGKGFETVECPLNLAGLQLPEQGTVLLECLSNLAANERYDPAGSGEDACRAILAGVDRLCSQCSDLILVSNEVFSGGSAYEGDTLEYLRLLARLNRELAARADNVCEVQCGIARYYKGKEPYLHDRA